MARRITHKAPDSLIKAKQQELQAKSASELATREASEISSNIAQLKKEEAEAQAQAAQAKESLAIIKAEVQSAEKSLDTARKELTVVRGGLSHAKEEIVKANKELESIRSEQEKNRQEASEAHQQKMKAIEAVQFQATAAERAALLRVDDLSRKVSLLESRVTVLRKEEAEITVRLLPKKTELETSIENLNHQKLTVEVEVSKEAEKLGALKGLVYKENALLEETVAKRLAEEKRIAEEQEKLAEREGEVEKKTQTLRDVQAGVNQSLARLEREKKDATLRTHLAQGKVIEE
jgi:chromosome segregation ATPase